MPHSPITAGTRVVYQEGVYTVRAVDGNVLELAYHTGDFFRLVHASSVLVCPPPATQTAASLPAPAAGQGAGTHPQYGEVLDFFGAQARKLVDLAAARPWDCSASDLRPILPSGDESFDSDIGRRRMVLLSMCVRHVLETGDGELSFFLGDTLQHLPDCEAYVSHLIERDAIALNGSKSRSGRLVWDVLKGGDVSDVANRPAVLSHDSSVGEKE